MHLMHALFALLAPGPSALSCHRSHRCLARPSIGSRQTACRSLGLRLPPRPVTPSIMQGDLTMHRHHSHATTHAVLPVTCFHPEPEFRQHGRAIVMQCISSVQHNAIMHKNNNTNTNTNNRQLVKSVCTVPNFPTNKFSSTSHLLPNTSGGRAVPTLQGEPRTFSLSDYSATAHPGAGREKPPCAQRLLCRPIPPLPLLAGADLLTVTDDRSVSYRVVTYTRARDGFCFPAWALFGEAQPCLIHASHYCVTDGKLALTYCHAMLSEYGLADKL
jgi:hypothetical protein